MGEDVEELFSNWDLNTLYEHALQITSQLDKISSGKDEEALYQEAITSWTLCLRRVESLGLFSWNEGVEDLSTTSIRYLLVEHYLGIILGRVRTRDQEVRRQHLEGSLELQRRFIKRILTYEMLDNECKGLIRPISTFPSLRDGKIARLGAINTLKQQLAIDHSSSLTTDEVEREMAIVLIRYKAIEAQSEIESIEAELELLRLRDQDSYLSENDKIASSQLLNNKPAGIDGAKKVTQPFILLNNRQQMAKNVFRPGHSLPTMTIDEYLGLEKKNGGIVQSNTNATPSQDEDEDKDEIIEKKLVKERSFDLFKDHNPRGSGNTHNIS